MSVINKRNAILGWAVWTVGKAGAKRKAKQAVQQPSDNRKAKGAAVLSGVAAAGSAVWFWRRRRSEVES